ncbi:MAG: CpsD/CapB family tyrosine-protein kinase [Eubacteriales bacterium]|nr:CpsD/CapB family tyrosine-protein kinase [Eubacteriales bacterium]
MKKIFERPIVTTLSPKSPEAEAFRMLRTNLQFTSLDKDIRTICITSTGPEEGKSSIIVNLGITMAQAGKKVLIVDCDLRKPVQHKIFKIGNIAGVTTVLSGNKEISEVVKDTYVEGLQLITSGPIPPNPAELLSSEKMLKFIRDLREDYDQILFDAPPALAVTDPIILSTKVDGTIFVISAGKSKVEKIKEVKDRLVKSKTNILGVVLNNVHYKGQDYYYYYYYENGDREE